MSGRKVFIDCGGFDGCSIRKFRSLHPQSTEFEIFTFEPNETLRQFYDDSITLIPAATWIENSEKQLFQSPNNIPGALNLGEGNSLFPNNKSDRINKDDKYAEEDTSTTVRTIDLSNWITDNFHHDDFIILKLSVEGAEYEILNKMTTDNSIDYINELFIKWHPDKIGLSSKEHETFINRLPIAGAEWDAMSHVLVEQAIDQESRHPANEVFRENIKTLKNSLLQQISDLERSLIEHSTVVVYTAIAGDIDVIEQPQVINDKVHYVCFSDRAIDNPGVWQIVPMDRLFLQSRKAAKRYKILPHLIFPEADYSLYIDGTFLRMNIDPIDAILRWLDKDDIALFNHPNRSCIYQEAEVCSRIKKDKPIVIRNQMERYRKEGYPDNAGLVAGGIILRRHNEVIANLNESWWKEIVSHSIRDQLSFNYVLWRNGIRCGTIPGNYFQNENFPYTTHKKDIGEVSYGVTSDQSGIDKRLNSEDNNMSKQDNLKLENIFDLKIKYSCDIPMINQYIRQGIMFPHPVGIVISQRVTIGKKCIVFQNVTIGASKNIPSHIDLDCYPTVGENVVFFAGAVVVGKITIGNNVIIAANSFVNKDIPDNCIVAGCPAKIIGENK